METAGTQGGLWLRSLIPINQIYTLIAVLIYSAISLDAVLWLLPLMTFYISFAVLIVVTAQMLQSRRRLGDVRTIASMLSRFMIFDEDTAASMYMWNSMKPYATFFLALPLCIASLGVADGGWLLCPEFGAMSAVTSIACFVALSNRYDHLALVSILIDTITTILPALIENLPQIPVIHTILWYLFGHGFAIELPVHGLYVRLGLPSLAFLIVPVIFVKMAARRSWQGTYQILVPHLVCIFWWRLTVAFLTRSTWFGIARAFVGWLALFFLLPFAPFFLVGYGIYIFRSITSFAAIMKILTTVVLVVGASAFVWWTRSGFQIGSWFGLREKSPIAHAAVILVIVVASCVPLAYIFIPPGNVDVAENKVGTLSWGSYHRYCLSPQASVVSCSKFKGAHVTAAGVVERLMVRNVENPAESFAAWLPYPFSNWLHCAYGEYYPDDCSVHGIVDVEEFEACTFSKRQGQQCHLRGLDRFTYELTLDVSESDGVGRTSVRVVAAHWFRSIASRLQPQTEVTFGAVLTPALPGPGLELKLESIRCVGEPCEIHDKADYEEDAGRWRPLFLLGRAIHSVWNFFLSPLVAFSS